MRQWLTDAGLAKYADKSIEEEYDDATGVDAMEEKEVEKWATAVGMKAGAESKLLRAWRTEKAKTQPTGMPLPCLQATGCGRQRVSTSVSTSM